MTKLIFRIAGALCLVLISATLASARPISVECLSDVDRPGARLVCAEMQAVARRPVRVARTRAIKADSAHAGIIRSVKTGATALVAVAHQAKFQGYIDAIEAEGGAIHYMNGKRAGPCSIPASKHPCGMALDVCQDYRGRVSGRKNCNLPAPARLAQIAARFGLLEGGVWCNSDYGHAEVRTARQAEGCGRNLYADVERWRDAKVSAPH